MVNAMIYFIQMEPNGPIKIGYTGKEDVAERLAGLQTSCPWPLRVLGVISGEVEDERRFHRQLAMHRSHGEWFQPRDEVLDLIGRLIGQELPRPAAFEAPIHRILNALPAALCDIVLEIASQTKVDVIDVLVEAARDGLRAIKPRWEQLGQDKSISARNVVADLIDDSLLEWRRGLVRP